MYHLSLLYFTVSYPLSDKSTFLLADIPWNIAVIKVYNETAPLEERLTIMEGLNYYGKDNYLNYDDLIHSIRMHDILIQNVKDYKGEDKEMVG